MREGAGARMPSLDGLRGLAILAVLIAHYFGEVPHGLRFLTAGWLGVELFFVLSGFLIGGILLDNRDSPNLFGVFYLRRVLRIFPVYYLVVAIVILSNAAPGSLPAATYFTYSQNFFMALSGRLDGFWLLPTWTLAVEEQFYLLLPLLIVCVPRRHLPAICIGAIVSGPLLRAALLFMHASMGALTLLPWRWDALFLGVLAAYAVREPSIERRLASGKTLVFAALCGAWGVCFSALAQRLLGVPVFDSVGYLFIGICFAALVARRTGFQHPVLRRLGCISYCLYLIHQPILGALHRLLLHAAPDVGTTASLSVTLLALAVSVALAVLSWTVMERHLIALGHHWRYGMQASALPVSRGRVSRTHAGG